MTTRNLPGALIVCAALALGACGDSDGPAGTGGTTLVGTWNLTHMNGVAMPIVETETFNGTTCTYTLQSLRITFNANGQFSVTETEHWVCTGMPPETETDTSTGTWTASGNTLTITEPGEGSMTATFNISGSILTISFTEFGQTFTLRFQRV
jgi:hypothetical protein